MNDQQEKRVVPHLGTGTGNSGQIPSEGADSHPGLPALANLFLVLFLWVAGTGLSVFLGQELARKGYFSAPPADSVPSANLPGDPGQKLSRMMAMGTATLLVFPAQLLLVVALMRHPGTGCYPSSWCGKRPPPLVVLGVGLGAVVASHGLWLVLGVCLTRIFSQHPEAHPLNTLLVQGGRWGLILVALQGCLVAPVMEEVLCRGYLMSLLATLKASSNWIAGMVVSLVLVGFAMDQGKFQGNFGWFNGVLLTALLVFPGCLIWIANGADPKRQAVWSGIVAQAQIFSCLHASSWPAPVALMPLALGLGWMRASGQPLRVCILVHALFNLVSLVLARAFPPA